MLQSCRSAKYVLRLTNQRSCPSRCLRHYSCYYNSCNSSDLCSRSVIRNNEQSNNNNNNNNNNNKRLYAILLHGLIPGFLKTGLAKISTHSTTWQFKTTKLTQRSIKSLYMTPGRTLMVPSSIPTSLPCSRFLDVTQSSPKRTAADIRTTFLSHCPCGVFAVH